MRAKEAAAPKDKKATLVVVGILNILLGLAFLLFGMLGTAAGMQSSAKAAVFIGMFVFAYAASLVWLGIGLLRAQRWARAITLMLAWFWLAVGSMGTATLLMMLPSISRFIQRQRGLNPQAALATVIILGAALALFYVVLPGIQVLALSARSVRHTCALRDPHIHWTDHHHLPVLVVCFVALVGGLFYLGIGLDGTAPYPFCGRLLDGQAARAAWLAHSAFSFFIAWGFFREDKRAWKLAILLLPLLFVATAWSYGRSGVMDELMSRMHLSPEARQSMADSGLWTGAYWISLTAIFTLGQVAYLLYCRRLFGTAKPDALISLE